MIRSYALNSYVYPVRMEMTGMKQIPISHFFSMEDSGSEEFPVDENLSHICSMDEDESKRITGYEISTEESES